VYQHICLLSLHYISLAIAKRENVRMGSSKKEEPVWANVTVASVR